MKIRVSKLEKTVLWHPLLPGILLVSAIVRIWLGPPTWITAVTILTCAAWLAFALWNRRTKGAWVESLEIDTSALRKAIETPKPMPAAPPAAGTREHARLVFEGIELVERIQREQAMPPPPLPSEEEIRATARPAIFLHRAALPVPLDHPGRSYLGGLPRLPPGLPWPEKETDERFALTFLAQIDLAELPVVESSPLPRSGTLYFFADTNNDGPEPFNGRVLYFAGDTTNVPVRELPEIAQPYGIGGEPWPWLPEESVWARTNFRFPLEFVPFDSFRDYFIHEGRKFPLPRGNEALNRVRGEEFIKRFGHRDSPTQNRWDVFQSDRDEWPFAWVAIDYGARAITRAVRDVLTRREVAEAATEYKRIRNAASKWIARAATEVPYARCDESTRAAFLTEWRALIADFGATSRRVKIHGPDPARALANILVASCYVCASHDAADVIPEIYRNALANLSDVSLTFPKHQMLGHGERVQWAPIQYADQILLLRLLGDDGLGWHSNIGCAMQFWVSAEALEQLAFDTVEMTLECD